jgi:hypothetical protein
MITTAGILAQWDEMPQQSDRIKPNPTQVNNPLSVSTSRMQNHPTSIPILP